MILSYSQRMAVAVGVVLILAVMIFPPFEKQFLVGGAYKGGGVRQYFIGHHLLFSPEKDATVHWQLLSIQLCAVVLLTIGGIFVLRESPKQSP